MYWDTGLDFVADRVNSGYRTICLLGLGLDSVADHLYYDYCIGTPDLIFYYDYSLMYWDTGLDFVADRVNSRYRMICVSGLRLDSFADHLYYHYCIGTKDWIFYYNYCLMYWDTGLDFVADLVNSGVSGLGLDSVADHLYYNYCIGTTDWFFSTVTV
jgi:hypothetical protein